VDGIRALVVTADDFGIGPATSRAILELAAEGRVTGTVLLVNTPYAEEAVRAWRQAGMALEMGWHPNLTLDAPVLPVKQVPSLVGPDGRFWPLGSFLRRTAFGRINAAEVRAELFAQHGRFCELAGRPPLLVNSHQHCQLFGPVSAALLAVLADCRPRPYVRRILEPWAMLARIPGARLKRTVLSWRGHRHARLQAQLGFPGNDWLAGITDPGCVQDPEFLVRWLTRIPGRVVELACHPGYHDPTLLGRDCVPGDGLLERRVCELALLRDERFPEVCRRAGFRLVPPSHLLAGGSATQSHAA